MIISTKSDSSMFSGGATMNRFALFLLLLLGYQPVQAAASGWTIRETDVREVCRSGQKDVDVCLFKEDGAIWINILDRTGYRFGEQAIEAHIDGASLPVTLGNSRTRPMVVVIKRTEAPKRPVSTSLLLRAPAAAVGEILTHGRTLTLNTTPQKGPSWQVDLALDGLADTLARL